jgi:hypothetical protein
MHRKRINLSTVLAGPSPRRHPRPRANNSSPSCRSSSPGDGRSGVGDEQAHPFSESPVISMPRPSRPLRRAGINGGRFCGATRPATWSRAMMISAASNQCSVTRQPPNRSQCHGRTAQAVCRPSSSGLRWREVVVVIRPDCKHGVQLRAAFAIRWYMIRPLAHGRPGELGSQAPTMQDSSASPYITRTACDLPDRTTSERAISGGSQQPRRARSGHRVGRRHK